MMGYSSADTAHSPDAVSGLAVRGSNSDTIIYFHSNKMAIVLFEWVTVKCSDRIGEVSAAMPTIKYEQTTHGPYLKPEESGPHSLILLP